MKDKKICLTEEMNSNVLHMKSLIFEKKYQSSLENFPTIEDITKYIERKEGRKLDYRRSDNIFMAKGESVVKINTTDPGQLMDTVLSKKHPSR